MHYIVYETINLINGMAYGGKHQTEKLDDGYLGSGKNLIAAIEEFGKENFVRNDLFFLNSVEEMNIKEEQFVNEDYKNNKNTYNIKTGGKGGWDHIDYTDPNIIKKRREVGTKVMNRPGHNKKMCKLSNTPKARKKSSIATSKRWQNPQYREKMCQMSKDLWQNDEYIEKMKIRSKKISANNKERMEDPDWKKRWLIAHKRGTIQRLINDCKQNPSRRKLKPRGIDYILCLEK